MKRNMGNADRILRTVVALVIGLLYYYNVITGTIGIVLLVLAGVFLLTSFISFCPLMLLLGYLPVHRKESDWLLNVLFDLCYLKKRL